MWFTTERNGISLFSRARRHNVPTPEISLLTGLTSLRPWPGPLPSLPLTYFRPWRRSLAAQARLPCRISPRRHIHTHSLDHRCPPVSAATPGQWGSGAQEQWSGETWLKRVEVVVQFLRKRTLDTSTAMKRPKLLSAMLVLILVSDSR